MRFSRQLNSAAAVTRYLRQVINQRIVSSQNTVPPPVAVMMTIKAKILSLVAAFAVMAAAITGLSLMTMAHYDRVIADYTRASNNAFRAEQLNLLLSKGVIEVRNVYIAKTPEQLETRISAMNARMTEVDALLKTWKAELAPGEIPQFASIENDARIVIGFSGKVADVARTKSPREAERLGATDGALAWREAFQDRLDAMVSGIKATLVERQARLEAYQVQRSRDFVVMAGSGILLVLLASLWVAIRSIANPLNRVTQSIMRLSEGAYDTAIPAAHGQDEISRLWGALTILKAHAIEAKKINDQKLELHLD
jgi:methyl-accepting chemotaxis protein